MTRLLRMAKIGVLELLWKAKPGQNEEGKKKAGCCETTLFFLAPLILNQKDKKKYHECAPAEVSHFYDYLQHRFNMLMHNDVLTHDA